MTDPLGLLSWLALSGWLTGLAALVLVVETAVLLRLPSHRRPRLALILPNAAAGICLIAALHAALSGWGGLAILVFLALALAGHAADLLARLR